MNSILAYVDAAMHFRVQVTTENSAHVSVCTGIGEGVGELEPLAKRQSRVGNNSRARGRIYFEAMPHYS